MTVTKKTQVPKVADCLGVAFPELNEGAKRVESVLREEEATCSKVCLEFRV